MRKLLSTLINLSVSVANYKRESDNLSKRFDNLNNFNK